MKMTIASDGLYHDVCLCGNDDEQEGFYSCDSAGRETEPMIDQKEYLVACPRCGRIFNVETKELQDARLERPGTEWERKAVLAQRILETELGRWGRYFGETLISNMLSRCLLELTEKELEGIAKQGLKEMALRHASSYLKISRLIKDVAGWTLYGALMIGEKRSSPASGRVEPTFAPTTDGISRAKKAI